MTFTVNSYKSEILVVLFEISSQLTVILRKPRGPRGFYSEFPIFNPLPGARQRKSCICITNDVKHAITIFRKQIVNPTRSLRLGHKWPQYRLIWRKESTFSLINMKSFSKFRCVLIGVKVHILGFSHFARIIPLYS